MTGRLALLVGLLCAVAPSVQAESADRAPALIGLARVKRDGGDLAAAQRLFEEAQRIHPFDTTQLAEYFWVVSSSSPARARVVGQTLIERRPGDDAVRERLIALAGADGDEAAVVALAAEGQRAAPGAARWPRRLAESALRRRAFADAAEAFARASAGQGALVEDRAGLALALEATGRVAEASNVWKNVSSADLNAHPDWQVSRLRSDARTLPPAAAASALEAWLGVHPDDRPVREALVDVWARAAEPMRALEVLSPLKAGPAGEPWVRRAIDLAQAAGRNDLVIAGLDELAGRRMAASADRRDRVSALLDVGDQARASLLIGDLVRETAGCDDRLLRLLDRFPDPDGTRLLGSVVRTRVCLDHAEWIWRAAERAVATGLHEEALRLLERLPPAEVSSLRARRLEGQLRFWTGDADGAMPLLLGSLEDDPADSEVRATLVDAYRARGRAYDAWQIGEPLLAQPGLDAARRRVLAELAIEADRPERALVITAELLEGDRSSGPVRQLRGQALLRTGRADEAVGLLEALDRSTLTPAAALALVDGLLAARGPGLALETARAFPTGTDEWIDLSGRRIRLEAIAGDRDEALRLLDRLAGLAPVDAALAEAEMALAEQRPLDAIVALERLAADRTVVPADSLRADDLRASAFAALGRYEAALEAIDRLLRVRPVDVGLLVRKTELAWRIAPDPTNLDEVRALPARYPESLDATLALVRVLAASQQDEAALQLLDSSRRRWPLPAEATVMAARSLRALGRPDEALARLNDTPHLDPDGALLKAGLLAELHRSREADAAFQALAARPGSTSALYLSWADSAMSARRRAEILTEGDQRFPATPRLQAALAAARLAIGARVAARLLAEAAVTRDPSIGDAWFTLLDATSATQSRADLDRALERFVRAAGDDAPLVIGMADHLAGMVLGADDPIAARTLAALQALPASDRDVEPRLLARARVLAATEAWDGSLAAIGEALAHDRRSATALRLRADVLSWAGRHAESIRAYDAYLDLRPGDLDARRQQARVAGWSGRQSDARRLYADLVARFPGNVEVEAEAEAKSALFDGRWRAAASAYSRWLILDPSNAEARFELAEAQRASGDTRTADDTLARLEQDTGHRLARAARARAAAVRRTAFGAADEMRSSKGAGDVRLLDLRRHGAVVGAHLGPFGGTFVALDVADVKALGAGLVRSGYRVGAALSQTLGRGLTLDGAVAHWRIGSVRPLMEGSVRVAWSVTDRWTLTGGAGRQSLLDNVVTLDRGIVATGPFAAAHATVAGATFDLRVLREAVSDGNIRRRLTVSAGRGVSERIRGLRAVGWAEYLGYRAPSPFYFSPATLVRADIGLEQTFLFATPRFRGDRQRQLTASYLFGVDNRGSRYQHPELHLIYEVGEGLALDGRAGVIRSDVYRETAVGLGLRVGGSDVR